MCKPAILLFIIIALLFSFSQISCFMDDIGCDGKEDKYYDPVENLDDDDDDDDHDCGDPVIITQWPTSGYFLRMWAAGEQFHLWVTSPSAITHIETWLASNPVPGDLGIPGGPIQLKNKYNPGYSYRMLPGAVSFAENWIELCDATPCYVEGDYAAWFVNPNAWCPWSAVVAKVWLCDGGDGTSCGSEVFP